MYSCSSAVGERSSPGFQTINIGRGCNFISIVLHEIMHAIGFWHEQSRPDRDEYVEILWENIKSGIIVIHIYIYITYTRRLSSANIYINT